jgi:hypothetical protein
MTDRVYKKIRKQMEKESDTLMNSVNTNLRQLNEKFAIFPLECDCCNQLKFFKVTDEKAHKASSIDCDDVTITTEERNLVNATYTLIDKLYVGYAINFIDYTKIDSDGEAGFVFAIDNDKFETLIHEKMKLL